MANNPTEKFYHERKVINDLNRPNLIMEQTEKDAKSIKRDTHPKELYQQCLRNTTYWHHYSARPGLPVEDMSMIVCKDLGCEINYCSLVKQSLPSEWEGSSDCVEEITNFNSCMKQEQRRYNWSSEKPANMYDYIWMRVKEKRQERGFETLNKETEQALEGLKGTPLVDVTKEDPMKFMS
jgi:hypothetical protein